MKGLKGKTNAVAGLVKRNCRAAEATAALRREMPAANGPRLEAVFSRWHQLAIQPGCRWFFRPGKFRTGLRWQLLKGATSDGMTLE